MRNANQLRYLIKIRTYSIHESTVKVSRVESQYWVRYSHFTMQLQESLTRLLIYGRYRHHSNYSFCEAVDIRQNYVCTKFRVCRRSVRCVKNQILGKRVKLLLLLHLLPSFQALQSRYFTGIYIRLIYIFFELRLSPSNQWIMRDSLIYTKFMDFPLPFAFSRSEARHYGRY